ncbi:N-methylhydantoinase B [Desulfocucumis palustris]|uniref:N-methylhydantoinase B n=1 Tax=Desulfocucumis palustris TaxID=1898651 RepID=A0A2L2XP67_9FIRM|nr:N-methylhydantoinase B [Desulfocucumis palustris]
MSCICSTPFFFSLIFKTAGGGDFGSPLERDSEDVRRDILEKLVSKPRPRKFMG